MAQFPSSMEMNVNSNIILRGKSNLSSKANSRSFLISSSTSSISYHEHMEMKNNRPKDNIREPIDSFQLSCKDNTDKNEPISRVADTSSTDGKQYVSNVASALNMVSQPEGRNSSNNSSNSSQWLTLNIQLLYDINQAIDQDS